MPSLIAKSFCVWKSLPFLMKTVYSTTMSPLPYPNVLIVDADPALAVNDPERLVVIPVAPVTPVNPEPSPTNDVAVTTPAILTLSKSVCPSTSKLPENVEIPEVLICSM